MYAYSYVAISVCMVHIRMQCNLTDLSSLLSDNGRPEGVELLLLSSRWWELLGNIVGTASAFSRFSAGTPKSSRYRMPSVTKQSSLKCFEHSKEHDEGPLRLLICRFTALIHLFRTVSSFGNECRL